MKKTWKRLCTGFLALATVVTALPTTPVHAESKQYWTGVVGKAVTTVARAKKPVHNRFHVFFINLMLLSF